MATSVSNLDERDTRSHADVVREIGATKLYGLLTRLGFEVAGVSTVQRWADRDSIPGEFWATLDREGLAQLTELAAYAESKKTGAPAAAQSAASPAQP